MKIGFTPSVAIDDSTFTLGTLDLAGLGVKKLHQTSMSSHPFTSDGGGGFILVTISTDGTVKSTDFVSKKGSSATSMPTGDTYYAYFCFSIRSTDMLDSFCD